MVPPEIAMSIGEIREVQLELLAAFDRLCRHEGLTYYLAYGTLLGAVRHGGYIPWDDDIDVMMPRGDYDRLPAAFAQAAPTQLSLSSPRTRVDWPFPYAKIGDERTELWEPLEKPLPLAVNLDVFPIDALPASPTARMLQSRVLRLLRWAVELRYIAAERGRGWHHPMAIRLGKPALRLVPMRSLVGAFTWTARGARRPPGGWGPGDRVGIRVGSFDWSVPAENLGTPVEVGFERLTVYGPADSGAVLTEIYGDYRRLPPVSARTSHHAFIATWRSSA